MAKATKKRRKSQKLSKNPTQESPMADPAATEQVFETFVQSNEGILAGMAALNTEMATFCNERLRVNVERSESLMGCSNAEEAVKIQWDFCQRATEQYLNQTSNLLGIMAKMNGDLLTAYQEQQRNMGRRLTTSAGGDSEE
jgi:hypothetical protein